MCVLAGYSTGQSLGPHVIGATHRARVQPVPRYSLEHAKRVEPQHALSVGIAAAKASSLRLLP
jgi:hypothetical protein